MKRHPEAYQYVQFVFCGCPRVELPRRDRHGNVHEGVPFHAAGRLNPEMPRAELGARLKLGARALDPYLWREIEVKHIGLPRKLGRGWSLAGFDGLGASCRTEVFGASFVIGAMGSCSVWVENRVRGWQSHRGRADVVVARRGVVAGDCRVVDRDIPARGEVQSSANSRARRAGSAGSAG